MLGLGLLGALGWLAWWREHRAHGVTYRRWRILVTMIERHQRSMEVMRSGHELPPLDAHILGQVERAVERADG